MKQKLLILLIRVIRFFHAEKEMIPELSCVPDGKVRLGRIYNHFGRILYAQPWSGKTEHRYFVSPLNRTDLAPSSLALEDRDDVPWDEVDVYTYEAARKADRLCIVRSKSSPCELCACWQLGLPCKCDFVSGTCSGYYTLVFQRRQYADN